ncbi:hypothetical protein EW026_g149 [Hermanssonia centrifuga]|uniref:Uncharacterized protein n=1 Tax=Hermanssonia centrifuga TaxID=98765 RepID=A0A4S4KWF9_9APHY|nr:hypothetical protein EW026_g149 [Hermanssonia centrifuga]
MDDCAVSVAVSHVRGYFHLAHAYNLLLAAQALKNLAPAKNIPPPARGAPSTLAYNVHFELDRVQLSWEFPLKMKLFTRIFALSAQRPASGKLKLQWDQILLAVPLDVERDGTPRVEWMELARISNWSVDIRPDVHPVAISAQGDSARLHIPYDYVLADLILDINLTVKCMKHLTRMIPSGQFENPPAPEAEEAKSMPDLSIRIGCLCVEAADDQFETQLGLIWRTGYESARLRLEREEAFEAKAAAVRAANQQDPSTPNRELQSEFQFTPEHTVSVEDALNRLYSLHAGSWASGFRQARAQQVLQQKTEMQKSMGKVDPPDALDTDLITIITAPPAPPLIRLNFDALSLHITGPSFPSSNLPDFLFNEGGGLPRDTQYSLLIPMHLTFAVASLRATCREYPLPLLNIPASSQKEISGLEFDSDVVIAEEMGTAHSVEWIDCAIVKAHTGVHGAPPLCVAVPKTLNPVKSYANPIIRVRTDDVTDFAWGVSYGPITQDLMRVVDTLSHAPRDDSPPIGFWDKLRLVFHWRLKVFFENDVHFHMKGSHDPHGLHGMGAGFALCWQGSPQLFINQKNDQNELIQVSSDSTLVVIPNIEESYGESSTTGPKTESHGTSASNKKCLPRKVCAKFGSGSRFGVGVALERTCGPDCPNCTGGTFDRQCRFFDFRPHYEVTLETKPQKPVENTPQDSYNGFRSDFIHLSISLTSSLNKDSDKYSSIHLSPAVFAHFWSWWTLFDGKALPIRQGGRYKHKRPLSPKFGQHLATIKYRIEVPHLFLSHIYMDESRDAWTDGVTPFVGVKAMIGRFQADMHQRTQQSTITTPDGAEKILIHKPFYAVEVVMKDLELRALLAIFSEPLKQRVPLEPNFLESSYRKRENIPVTETNSPWVDADDFLDVERASANTSENRVERTKFGDENSHECLLGKEASVLQAQIDIVRNRITELRDRSANEADPCASTRPERQFTTDTNYMISLLETYIQKLEEESRTVPSNEPQSYYMPSDSVSSKDWAEFDNVYQVHCPKLYLDNIVRDIMMQYYYCSRARRGVEYHMATRAVKFIRDQALTAIHNFEHENIEPDKHRGHATGVAQTATQAVRKILGGGDGGPSTSVESSSEPLFHTPDNRDPLKGWSKGVSLRKGHFCLLLKPQLILRSETSTESVCVLTAVQGNLQTYHIMDDVNADDPVSGKIMNSSSLFDRLVPQTNATFHYDKFNRLRLRNEITSVARTSHDGNDQMHNHLQSQNDLVRFHVPRFTVSANDRHFQAISNIVTNLLLFSDAAHKTRAERLEKMLFSYDFTNLSSAADVVSKLQIRLRMAVETRRQAQSKLQGRGDTGQVEKLKIEAHILLLAEELDYVFEAIKLAQDKADGQAAQKSALLLHASSSEISWHMLDRHDQLLAKLAVRDIDFRWLNRQDSSTVNHLEVGNLQAFDGAADAEWTEILSKYDEPSNHPLVKRKLFCVADWTVLPPVGAGLWSMSGQPDGNASPIGPTVQLKSMKSSPLPRNLLPQLHRAPLSLKLPELPDELQLTYRRLGPQTQVV